MYHYRYTYATPFRLNTGSITAVLAYAALQNSNPQPGRNRPDASSHNSSSDARPTPLASPPATIPLPRPSRSRPPDSRITAALRMTDDTRSDDFPGIVSNPRDRDEVWCGWLS